MHLCRKKGVRVLHPPAVDERVATEDQAENDKTGTETDRIAAAAEPVVNDVK